MPSDEESDGGRREAGVDAASSHSMESLDGGGEDFPEFASGWKKPPSTKRTSWRTAFQHMNSKNNPFQTNPLADSLKSTFAPFTFQSRRTRIDWRTLHSIDVDQIIRETDIVKLESILDTVAFGDVQGEDTRNFTEANFIKLFRLSQLMIEYLLHMQDFLGSQKTQLLETGEHLFKRSEKFRLRCIWQHEALYQSRRDLQRCKKTLRTYESLLQAQSQAARVPQNNTPPPPPPAPPQPKQAHYCPFCEKVFESSLYLDMHITRRHSTSKQQILEAASRKEPQIKQMGYAEEQSFHSASQINALQMALKESDNKLRDVQEKLDTLQKTIQNPTPSRKDYGDRYEDRRSEERRYEDRRSEERRHEDRRNADKPDGRRYADRLEERKAQAAQEKLKELEVKFGDFENQIKQLGQENSKLLKELNAAYTEVSGLKSEKRRFILSMDKHDEQVEELQQEIEDLRRSLRKDYVPTSPDRKPKPIKDWLKDAEIFQDKPGVDYGSRLSIPKRLKCEETTPCQRFQAPKKSERYTLHSIEDPLSRVNPAAANDALTEGEEDISNEKEEWLKLHPYAPLEDLPYVLAQYPHSPALFVSKRGEVSRRLDKLLRDELQKFGIPPNAEGISDAKYAVVASALEKQRAYRFSSASANERRIMEFERSTILWHIERAVNSRDMTILDTIFDQETEAASHHDQDFSDFDGDQLSRTPSPDRRGPESYYEGDNRRFESEFSARRSVSRPTSVHSDAFGRGRDNSDVDILPLSSIDHHALSTFEFERQHSKRVPADVGEPPRPISPVASANTIPPDQNIEQLDEDIGLGDWESDDGGASSFLQGSSHGRSLKDDHNDGASTTTSKVSP